MGDGGNNPDTAVDDSGSDHDKSDLYRLYLDVSGKSIEENPIDLLVVVDRSGSMDQDDMGGSFWSKRARDTAVTQMLNGITVDYESLNNGFIKKFLDLNEKNQIAVTTFEGITGQHLYSSHNKYVIPNFDYNRDAKCLKNWSSHLSFVDAQNVYNNGTHYEAGLLLARDMFNRVKNNNHKKMMIFISDGVPTFYIDDSGARRGNGIFRDQKNVNECRQPSKDAFDVFHNQFPDVTVHSVGVSKDITATNLGTSQSPDVLKYMASRGGGFFIGVNDQQALIDEMMSLLQPYKVKKLKVIDKLSEYVNVYDRLPDFKVTRKDKSTGTEVTLWENGHPTANNGSAAGRIINDVTHSNGKVEMIFNPNYEVDEKYVYTLSFNAEVTDNAYNEYAGSGYKHTGDRNTDYPRNITSSQKAGFYSNNQASVEYELKNEKRTEYYDHPVVQVSPVRFNLYKVGKNGTTQLQGSKFDIYAVANSWDPGAEAVPGTNYEYGIKKITGIDDTYINGNNSIALSLGKYYLVETKAPEGYMILKKPIKFKLERRKVKILSDEDNATVGEANISSGTPSSITIKNNPVYKLPNTGGMGIYIFMIIGSFMVSLSVLLAVRRIKSEKYAADRQ